MESALTRSTMLQINATIIAGLLIFLTIQSITTDSLFDLAYNYRLLAAEDKVLQNLGENITEAKKLYENKDKDGNIIIEATPTGNPGEASFKLPAVPLSILEKQELQISGMSDENFKNRVKLQAKLDARHDMPLPLILYSNPQFVVSILITPFIASMMTELLAWNRNRTKQETNVIAFWFFILGLVIMLGIFLIYLLIHISTP